MVALLFVRGVAPTLAGVLAGIPAATAATRLLSGVLFGVSSLDPAVYAGVAGVLVVVGLAGTYVPARRAARVDPIVAFRYE